MLFDSSKFDQIEEMLQGSLLIIEFLLYWYENFQICNSLIYRFKRKQTGTFCHLFLCRIPISIANALKLLLVFYKLLWKFCRTYMSLSTISHFELKYMENGHMYGFMIPHDLTSSHKWVVKTSPVSFSILKI